MALATAASSAHAPGTVVGLEDAMKQYYFVATLLMLVPTIVADEPKATSELPK